MQAAPVQPSQTVIHFDLREEMTQEEIENFEAAAERSGANSLTDFFLDRTIRIPQAPHHAA